MIIYPNSTLIDFTNLIIVKQQCLNLEPCVIMCTLGCLYSIFGSVLCKVALQIVSSDANALAVVQNMLIIVNL